MKEEIKFTDWRQDLLKSWLEIQELKTAEEHQKDYDAFMNFLYTFPKTNGEGYSKELGNLARNLSFKHASKESLTIHRDNPLEDIYVQPLTTEKINELGEAIRDSNSITLRYQITKEEFEELLRKS